MLFGSELVLFVYGIIAASLVGIALLAWGISVLFALPYGACVFSLIALAVVVFSVSGRK